MCEQIRPRHMRILGAVTMMQLVVKTALRGALVALCAGVVLPMSAQAQNSQRPALTAEETYALARDAYLYAYPIVSFDVTMRQATNVPDAESINIRAPINQFANARAYPKADEKDVVRFNFDTLYSLAWIDLSKEPIIASVPDMGNRYYLLPMLDMWTDVFAVIGTRTTGNGAGNYALVGPNWTGSLPEGMTKIVAPTSTIWIGGRTKTDGPADYANVHKAQDGYKLTPLSQWGKAYQPPKGLTTDSSVDNKTPPLVQVNNLDGITMLTRLADLLATNAPHANDYPILLRLRRLGIEPGKPFDASKLTPETVAIINKAAKETLASLPALYQKSSALVNGWNMQLTGVGTYGANYLQRTFIAMGGLGANVPEDAVYPTATVDSVGKQLSGANKYILRFEKGKLPPTNAFWSITMYDMDGFQVLNAINRFAIGSYDKLNVGPDGATEIYVQAESPGKDKEANWLPAPKGDFQPTMRLYSPKSEVLNGDWSPPAFKRMD